LIVQPLLDRLFGTQNPDSILHDPLRDMFREEIIHRTKHQGGPNGNDSKSQGSIIDVTVADLIGGGHGRSNTGDDGGRDARYFGERVSGPQANGGKEIGERRLGQAAVQGGGCDMFLKLGRNGAWNAVSSWARSRNVMELTMKDGQKNGGTDGADTESDTRHGSKCTTELMIARSQELDQSTTLLFNVTNGKGGQKGAGQAKVQRIGATVGQSAGESSHPDVGNDQLPLDVTDLAPERPKKDEAAPDTKADGGGVPSDGLPWPIRPVQLIHL